MAACTPVNKVKAEEKSVILIALILRTFTFSMMVIVHLKVLN